MMRRRVGAWMTEPQTSVSHPSRDEFAALRRSRSPEPPSRKAAWSRAPSSQSKTSPSSMSG